MTCCGTPIAVLKSSERQQVVRDLSEKLRLERILRRELAGPFRRMADAFAIRYRADGQMPETATFRNQIQSLLTTHYDRTAQAFRKSVEIRKQTDIDDATAEAIALAILAIIETFPPREADLIADTTEREMEMAVNRARNTLAQEGEAITTAAIAAIAANELRRRFATRKGLIAQTETQSAAEATRMAVAEASGGIVPEVIAGTAAGIALIGRLPQRERSITKSWVTVGDDRVRPWHSAADRQTVEMQERFLVGPDRMRYPGDVLNGSVANIARCRCSSVYREG